MRDELKILKKHKLNYIRTEAIAIVNRIQCFVSQWKDFLGQKQEPLQIQIINIRQHRLIHKKI
jgi:hypothetical protein